MDKRQVGEFLAQLRKEMNFTQEELGEKIGVTNKTVSRWETGDYIPPVEMLLKLSEIYQISINEILSGRRLEDEEYIEVAENNMTTVLGELEENKKRWDRIYNGFFYGTAIVVVFIIGLVSHTILREHTIEGALIIAAVVILMMGCNVLNLSLYVSQKEK